MFEPRILLHGVTWETYERLVEEIHNPGVRLTYDRGELEIMTVSHAHERWKKLLGRMIEAMTEELGIAIRSGGSATFKRRDLQRGLEPDECYWIQREHLVRGKRSFDFTVDPAPDLAIEAEVTHSILDRLDILASLDVSEVWRYDGNDLRVFVLGARRKYAEQTASRCFPWLPLDAFAAQLQTAESLDETSWIRAFRAWVRTSARAG
jgi:Uma2 family endonuclease